MSIDYMIQKAFSDGYSFAQREYADKRKRERDDEDSRSRRRSIADYEADHNWGHAILSAGAASVAKRAGIRNAERLERENPDASDEELRKAARRGGAVGGALAAGSQALIPGSIAAGFIHHGINKLEDSPRIAKWLERHPGLAEKAPKAIKRALWGTVAAGTLVGAGAGAALGGASGRRGVDSKIRQRNEDELRDMRMDRAFMDDYYRSRKYR